MNILLTGGTGLIGSALVTHWHNQHQLWVLSRDSHKAEKRLGNKAKVISELSAVDFNQLDAVINLAGEPIADKRWTAQQKQRLCQSRWQLTEQLVQAINAADTPPSVLISGSAIGIYGRQDASLIHEDFSHYHCEFTHLLCQRWEQIALQAQSDKTRVCLLRTGIVLSAKGGALAKMLPAFKLGLGGRVGSGEQYMSWIHLSDMLRLIEFLLLHPTLTGPFNATAPAPVTNTEFSQTLAKVLHRPAIFPVPAFVLKLLLGEMADLLLTGQRVLPANLVKAGFEFKFATLAPALQDLQG
ncbi:TIGR01777 family oxidoreductase [Rheinheimera nanhaiensis]|uniref:Epimerase family protein yfcH n=1 Tax=Rheinheimera nanhaiensis E407-8 TaxID=562729 RepID=I1E1H7_9GAMM|nr:TIGR01777 family oxidoreductase [Rheinheimera nanhaiensis]GAB60155.1 epimerase family protein yfcH [Rheinheimera nanhaiensis E407-8]